MVPVYKIHFKCFFTNLSEKKWGQKKKFRGPLLERGGGKGEGGLEPLFYTLFFLNPSLSDLVIMVTTYLAILVSRKYYGPNQGRTGKQLTELSTI